MGSPKDMRHTQGALFELAAAVSPKVLPVTPRPAVSALAAKLPRSIAFGGMTWTFPGWIDHVYAKGTSEKQLAAHGLAAYAAHPLLRRVEIDRTYYGPLAAEDYRDMAEQVPSDFRFFVKAHEDCVVERFPLHARYGVRRGLSNPNYLDAAYARDVVVGPTVEGLGQKLGGLLFQFPPRDARSLERFVERLHTFLSTLPPGVPYAVELRNRELLTPLYGEALRASGTIHCHNVWTNMPDVLTQARSLPKEARRPLFVRWLMRPDDHYEDARVRYEPFDRIVSEDPITREGVARLVVRAHQHDVPVVVLVDNKAEGCAPASVVLLAEAIAEKLTVASRSG